MANEPKDLDMERLDKVLLDLGEHFDSVQIFASRYNGDDNGTTTSAAKGIGNWFARYGQVREWCVKQDENTRINERRPDDDP